MIHTARSIGKFIKLVRRLRALLPSSPVDHETIAVGILERMWHHTLTSAKRGDIGRDDDEIIAEAVGWLGDAETLINLLVECGWLDRSDEHRLVVHDWSEHAPSHIKKNASRWGGLIGNPSTNGLSEPLSEPISNDRSSPEPFSGDYPTQVSRLAATPNLTKPNQTKPNPHTARESVEGKPAEGPGDPARWPYRSPEFVAAWRRWLEHSANCLGRRLPTKTDAELAELFRLKNEENALRWIEHSIRVSTKANLCDPATFSRGSPPGSEAHEVEQKRKAERDAAVERTQERRRKLRESRKKGRKSA